MRYCGFDGLAHRRGEMRVEIFVIAPVALAIESAQGRRYRDVRHERRRRDNARHLLGAKSLDVALCVSARIPPRLAKVVRIARRVRAPITAVRANEHQFGHHFGSAFWRTCLASTLAAMPISTSRNSAGVAALS